MASIRNADAITNVNTVVDGVDTDTVQATPTLVFYSGTPPVNVDTALSANTPLATLTFATPAAFGAASDQAPGARASALAIGDETSATAGTTTFARVFDRATTPLARIQYTAGSGAEEIVLNSAVFSAGATVSVTALHLDQPEI